MIRMIRMILALSMLVALTTATGVSAQPWTTQPPPPLVRNLPPPVITPAQPRPVQPDDNLRPLPTQTDLPVERFEVSQLRCATGLGSASQLMQARLIVQPHPVSGNIVSIDVLVDGVSTGPETLRIVAGGVEITRRIQLEGSGGEHRVVFVLNGSVQSEAQVFSYSCITLRPATVPAPGHLVQPNMAFGDLLYAELQPTVTLEVNFGFGSRVAIRSRELFTRPIIVTDIRSTSGRIQFPSNEYCPVEQDAYVTGYFAIAVDIDRVADPQNYVRITPIVAEPEVNYVDTREQSLWSDGSALDTERIRGTPLPQGYQWLVIRTGLACTRNGVLEVRLDPDGRLPESYESDNVLRLRYATVPQ